MCAGASLFGGGMRWRVFYTGQELFFTYSPLVNINDISFFDSFEVSPTAKSTMVEIRSVLKDYYGTEENWRSRPIFFGPRIEFAYAVFNILSPQNIPIWWHPNNSYPSEREAEFSNSFLNHHFETAIFIRNPVDGPPDFGFLPKIIVADLKSNYESFDYSSIVVFRKK